MATIDNLKLHSKDAQHIHNPTIKQGQITQLANCKKIKLIENSRHSTGAAPLGATKMS
jgi:hypothetical protein